MIEQRCQWRSPLGDSRVIQSLQSLIVLGQVSSGHITFGPKSETGPMVRDDSEAISSIEDEARYQMIDTQYVSCHLPCGLTLLLSSRYSGKITLSNNTVLLQCTAKVAPMFSSIFVTIRSP